MDFGLSPEDFGLGLAEFRTEFRICRNELGNVPDWVRLLSDWVWIHYGINTIPGRVRNPFRTQSKKISQYIRNIPGLTPEPFAPDVIRSEAHF